MVGWNGVPRRPDLWALIAAFLLEDLRRAGIVAELVDAWLREDEPAPRSRAVPR